MAVKFGTPETNQPQASTAPMGPAPTPTPTPAPSTSTLNFMKRGDQAVRAYEQAEATTEARREESGKAWRFMITKKQLDQEFKLTFLDGDLGEQGLLNIPMYYEHTVAHGGYWRNYVCTDGVVTDEPCPICIGGDQPAFVGVMSVLDHTPRVDKLGKSYPRTRRLYVVKRTTIKQLTKIAKAYGGLSGCTFMVSRSTENVPNAGDTFVFIEKASVLELQKAYGEDASPLIYEQEITFRYPAELRALGIGGTVGAGTVQTSAQAQQQQFDQKELASKL